MYFLKMESFTPKHWDSCYRLYQQIYQESYPYRDLPEQSAFLQNPGPYTTVTSQSQGFILGKADRWLACCHYKIHPQQKLLISEIKFLQEAFDNDGASHIVQVILDLGRENKVEVIQMVAENKKIRDSYLDSGDFIKVGQVRESVLALDELDADQQHRWASLEPSYCLQNLVWDQSPQAFAALKLYNECQEDVPMQDVVRVTNSIDQTYFQALRDKLKAQGRILLSYGLWQGEAMLGLALFDCRETHPRSFTIQFTGIERAARGKGIGKALKALSTHRLREIYPEAKYIITGNEESNIPMLKINQAMGFKVQNEYTMLRYQKPIT